MKVTAYQDPVSGELFTDEAALDKFVRDRKKREAESSARRKATSAVTTARNAFKRELVDEESFSRLARALYEAVIAQYEERRKGRPLLVVDVRLRHWALTHSRNRGSNDSGGATSDAGLSLNVEVEVVLNDDPYQKLKGDAPASDLSPCAVLKPFELYGGGGARSTNEGYVMAYTLTAALGKFPSLLKQLTAQAVLEGDLRSHDANVAKLVSERITSDEKTLELEAELERERHAFDIARDAFHRAQDAVTRRCGDVRRSVELAHPFEGTQALEALRSANHVTCATPVDRGISLDLMQFLVDDTTRAQSA